jgi:hypothetical protein
MVIFDVAPQNFKILKQSSTKRGKGRGDRCQGGRATPLRDREEFDGRRAARKLREFFRQEVRAELRAVAALNNAELITVLISFNCQLALGGLQLRILNGVVSLLTTRVENKALAAYVSEQSGASGNLQMTTATLEVLACIAFRQSISQAEIDRLFDADKRGLVVKPRDLKLVEGFAGVDGRLRFATRAAHRRSGLPLRYGAAEPVLETRRADARVIAGGEALIVYGCTEVACADVCGHLPCVSVCAQESSDEFVETYRFRTRQLDRAVQRLVDCDVGQRGCDVIGHDGLHQSRWQPNRLPFGGRLGDAADELEELHRADDRMGTGEALIRFSWAIFARK